MTEAVAPIRVHDFTPVRRRLPVTVEASPVYELLLSLFVFSGEHDKESYEYECGSTFFEQVEHRASAQLKVDLEVLAGCGELWLGLIGLAHERQVVDEVDSFIEQVAAEDAVALRHLLLQNAGLGANHGFDPDVVAAAAAGDPEALERLFRAANGRSGLRRLFDRGPDDSRERLVEVLRRFADEVFELDRASLAALRHDAAEKRALAAAMAPEELVEHATNGVTFRHEPAVTGVLLIPSIVLRPWVVITEHGPLRIFSYPVSDESLSADPDAPPSFIVEFYKALGDERRLRLLAELRERPATLHELTDVVGLAKSTVHHHMRQLRTAGLVRVTVTADNDKVYSLREQALAEAGPMLDRYLHGDVVSSQPTRHRGG